MKAFVIIQVGLVLIIGLSLRWLCASQGIGRNQLMLIDGAVIALALAALAYGLNRIVKPYELIRRRVAEAALAKKPRSVTVDGFSQQRDLAREIDTLMRLLEERMEDPNLGPVYLRGGKQRADTFVDDENTTDPTNEPGTVSQPEILPYTESEVPQTNDPILDSVAPHEPFRELFVSYVQALRQEDRANEISSYSEFTAALDHQRDALLEEHPGYDVLFFLSDGPQIKPRLVPATGIDTPR